MRGTFRMRRNRIAAALVAVASVPIVLLWAVGPSQAADPSDSTAPLTVTSAEINFHINEGGGAYGRFSVDVDVRNGDSSIELASMHSGLFTHLEGKDYSYRLDIADGVAISPEEILRDGSVRLSYQLGLLASAQPPPFEWGFDAAVQIGFSDGTYATAPVWGVRLKEGPYNDAFAWGFTERS